MTAIGYSIYFLLLTALILNSGLLGLVSFPGVLLLIVPYALIALKSPVSGLAVLIIYHLSQLKSITPPSGTFLSLSILFELCLLGVLISRLLLTRKFLRFQTAIPFYAIIYLGFYVVACIWRSSLSERGEGVKQLVLLLLVLVWIIAFVDSREKFISFLRSLIVLEILWFVGAAYHALRYGTQDLALRTTVEQGYLEKVVGVDNLAVSVLMFLPLVYFFLSLKPTGAWRFLAWLSFGLSLATTVITFSRNGFINMLVVLFLIFFRRMRSSRILIFILILIMIVLLAPSSYWGRISTIPSLKVESGLSHKISLLQIGLDIVIRNPVFGIGLGKLTRAVHNTVLQIAVEVGLFALFVFLMLLYKVFREIKRARFVMNISDEEGWSTLPLMISISLVAYLIGGLTISIPRYLPFIIILGLIVAAKGINSGEALALEEHG